VHARTRGSLSLSLSFARARYAVRVLHVDPQTPPKNRLERVGAIALPRPLSPPRLPAACGYVPSYMHHANATANTPRHVRARAAAISWKPGRCLGTPDPLNKTPLHVAARLAPHDAIGNFSAITATRAPRLRFSARAAARAYRPAKGWRGEHPCLCTLRKGLIRWRNALDSLIPLGRRAE
jgi:hypothetical protein